VSEAGHRNVVAICAALGALVLLVFGQTWRHEFVNYDDILYVYGNPDVVRGSTVTGVLRAFTHKEFGLWNPLVTISHIVDCRLYGLHAGGHHLTNVSLHLASVILLFLVFHGMTGAVWRSALAAALFAIHPLRAESVAWVSERKDVLSGLFFMLTLGAYARYVRRPDSRMRYGAVIVLFSLGLMCKPMLVTLPFVLLLLDYWPLNRLFAGATTGRFPVPDWRVVREKIPLFALSLALILGMVLPTPAPSDIEIVPLTTRLAEAPVALLAYLGQLAWPFHLAAIYPRSPLAPAWWPLAALLLGMLSLLAFLLRKNHPYLWMGWLWNLGMLVPVSGIVQISRHWMADHYTYLPQIGLYVALSWALGDYAGTNRLRRMVAVGLTACVLILLSLAAHRQTAVWKTSGTLWNHTIAVTSDNVIARTNLGFDLLQRGRPAEAEQELRAALVISPHFAGAHNHLGTALMQQDRPDEAIRHYEEALRISPSFAWAHNNLGIALCQTGNPATAAAHFRKALVINPADAEARYNLASALEILGNSRDAVEEYRRALDVAPDDAETHNSLGRVLASEGQAEEGVHHARRALAIKPDHIAAKASLAWMLATARPMEIRDGREAVRLAEDANRATGGNNPDVLRVLAAARAEAGDFRSAISAAERALAGAEGDLASKLQSEIASYRDGRAL
jgi:Tfp pilus assembly protein PilF